MAGHLRKVLTILTVGVDVDGPILQTILRFRQIDSLLENSTTTPTSTVIGEPHIIITTGNSRTGRDFQIGATIIGYRNCLILKIIGNSAEIHPLTFWESLVVNVLPTIHLADEAIGGLKSTTVRTVIGRRRIHESIHRIVSGNTGDASIAEDIRLVDDFLLRTIDLECQILIKTSIN